MPKLWRLIDDAMNDAAKADALVRDPQARRSLREDPEGMLRSFALRARIDEQHGARRTRSERRDRGVREARRQAVSPS